jgi:uncharacterized protein YdhG (YjbR/CyaY superfamily)
MEKHIPKNIDEYIAGFPIEVQEIMNRIRTTINEAAPEAKVQIKQIILLASI